MSDRARDHLLAAAELYRAAADAALGQVAAAGAILVESFRAGAKLLLAGNGGSAADCQHIAAELTSRLRATFDRPALPAIALTTDTSFLTAYANDSGFEGVFERQVEALGRPGDVLLAISTSGNSANLVRAVARARELGLRTISLSGEGGRLADIAECPIVIPGRDTQHIQEVMLGIEHVLCEHAERELFGEPS